MVKQTGICSIVVEMIKNGVISIIDWLLRIFSRCRESGVGAEGWKAACIVPICKWNGDRRECTYYRGISILSILGKIYWQVLISTMIEST